MIKWIRSVPAVNVVVRTIVRWSSRCTRFLEDRWRVSGVIEMEFDKVKFKYFSRADDSLADILFYRKKYAEDADIKAFVAMVAKAKVVFDIGANTGLYSVIGAAVNPGSKIYSFEPHPANCKRLRKNIEVNGIRNVTVVEKAAGDIDSGIKFFVPESGGIIDTSSALRDFSESTYRGRIAWRSIIVTQTALDNFVAANSIDRIDLMKIDVEGYELSVFEGAKDSLKKFKPVIICEIFLNEQKRKYFQEWSSQLGYVSYMILSEGLVRLDGELIVNVSGLNYMFSTVRSAKVFTPMSEVGTLIAGNA